MKVQIISEEVYGEVCATTGRLARVYEARENTESWVDTEGKPFAFELILLQSDRLTWSWCVHADEVKVLTPAEELAVLGHPGYSDDLAEQVLLYMMENDISAQVALGIVQAKDIATTDHYDRPRPLPSRVQGGTTKI